jgi:hypothetical protein
MGRLTITIEDNLHRAVKEAAARQGRSIGQIIEESLRLRGIKPMEDALQLVARARSKAGRSEKEALDITVDETRSHRGK